MPTRHGDKLAKKRVTSQRRSFLRTTTFPVASTPCTWNTLLARSSPIVATLMADDPHPGERVRQLPSWHAQRRRGGRPSHQGGVISGGVWGGHGSGGLGCNLQRLRLCD